MPDESDTEEIDTTENRYLVSYVRSVAAPGAKVLDFGCGAGGLVQLLREAGFDASGCDVRWPGADYTWDAVTDDTRAALTYYEPGGRLPYDDDTFDVVLSAQVFEHVEPIREAVDEIERVVRPDGVMYHVFPTLECWREGHIGLPFSHRLRPGALRTRYASALHRMGFGLFRDRPREQWVTHSLAWIDEWTVYRDLDEIHRIFGAHATVRHNEIEYCRFRAGDRRWLRAPMDARGLDTLAAAAYRRLGSICIECRPLPAPVAAVH